MIVQIYAAAVATARERRCDGAHYTSGFGTITATARHTAAATALAGEVQLHPALVQLC